MGKKVVISVVSHGQWSMADALLDDLNVYCADDIAAVLLTINVPEYVPLTDKHYGFPLCIIRNSSPKGFGANHNAAFRASDGDFFCVLNPDIRLCSNPFPALLELAKQDGVGVVAPSIVAPDGSPEDSARKFPSPIELARKVFGGKSAVHTDCGPVLRPDWIAGMFMVFPKAVFEEMGGFDERYFLYYEDVDLCARLALRGYKRLVCSSVNVVHHAQRASRRQLRYMLIHAASILRFFCSDVYGKVCKTKF